jgi:chymotrypsin
VNIHNIITESYSGALITNRAVLTTVHRIHFSSDIQVILGAHNIVNLESTQQRFKVLPSAYRLHPGFNSETFLNNIAILILPTPAVLNSYVNVIALPALGDTRTFEGLTGTATGWGRTGSMEGNSRELRSVQNPIVSNAACTRSYGRGVFESNICISGEGFRGPCHQDDGGPLTVQSGGQTLLVGVMTLAEGVSQMPCQQGWYGIYNGSMTIKRHERRLLKSKVMNITKTTVKMIKEKNVSINEK